ncbi:MAG: AI-2E family transporter [Bacteroidaceae bacterium]|nr:AI-2E family transporter [Bacteroidaceae bacterium]MBQ9171423.1 AI-2E family transporter [Bacteroidaceae bacterium]MBQ9294817.1 AI-2E family transporter [Bacteroidaceae bacterium]
MLEKEITFDRVVRWLIVALVATGLVLLVNRLSSVLLPFFVAWILAYMIYPFVRFLQYRCKLKYRVLSIAVALLVVLAVLTLATFLVVPPIVEESVRMAKLITVYFNDTLASSELFANIQAMLQSYASDDSLMQIFQHSSVMDMAENLVLQVWEFLSGTINFAIGLLGSLVVLLYLVFILMDYEKISEGWIKLIPAGKRGFASMVADDVKSGMNAYFRGQSLIALLVGILFSIGFLIIDFPMAIGLGLFIGVLNLIPYLQLVGFIPTIILALVKAADTGQSFWVIMICALAVFAVVQTIQDMYLTPRIMGHVMGLNPAIILLSLSIWGSLLGIIGLIIALPLTTLLISYYRRFILKETDKDIQKQPDEGQKAEGNK